MKRFSVRLLTVIASLLILAHTASGQDTDAPVPPADPADVATPDAIIGALYDVISGPAGAARNWDRMRSLFVPGARLIPTGVRPDGPLAHRVMTVADYLRTSGPVL